MNCVNSVRQVSPFPSIWQACLSSDKFRVIFKNTDIEAPLNKTFWSIWDPGDDRTSNVTLADWHSTGPGTRGAVRPSFVNILTSEEAANYSIASAVGSDYADWVDMEYFV